MINVSLTFASAGSYTNTTVTWTNSSTSTAIIATTWTTYPALNNTLLLELHLLSPLHNTSLNTDAATCAAFPALRLDTSAFSASLGYAFWHGLWPIPHAGLGLNRTSAHEMLPARHDGPVAFSSANSLQRQTLVLGPVDNPVDTVWDVDVHNRLSFGPSGMITNLDVGFRQTLAVTVGAGMQDAMAGYGTVVKAYAQARSETDDVLRKLKDPTLTELGLWTDNGAVLFWNDEGKEASHAMCSGVAVAVVIRAHCRGGHPALARGGSSASLCALASKRGTCAFSAAGRLVDEQLHPDPQPPVLPARLAFLCRQSAADWGPALAAVQGLLCRALRSL